MNVDGVLNSEKWYRYRQILVEYQKYLEFSRELHKELPKGVGVSMKEYCDHLKTLDKDKLKLEDKMYHTWEFDPEAVERLNIIIDATDAKLVISSTWRTDPDIDNILKHVGIKGKIVGKTPSIHYARYGNSNEEIKASIPRGLEIQEWMERNIESWEDRHNLRYVILDDDADFWQIEHFIKTDRYTGLSDEDVERAVEILNNKKRTLYRKIILAFCKKIRYIYHIIKKER